jgi:hypothetical protein
MRVWAVRLLGGGIVIGAFVAADVGLRSGLLALSLYAVAATWFIATRRRRR